MTFMPFYKIFQSKGCFSEFLFFCFLTITTSNLHQIQEVRSVFKSEGSKDFKTVPTFDNQAVSVVLVISQTVMQDVKLRFLNSRRAITTAENTG